MNPRSLLLECYASGLAAVNGASAVNEALNARSFEEGRWHLLCVGKASESMAKGANESLGNAIVRGLVISKNGHFEGTSLPDHFTCLEAEHPVPAEGSLAAGKAMVAFCDSVPEGEKVLVCISGGASSLVEVLPDSMTLDDLQHLTQRMLADAYSIAQINELRRALSCVKAGKLAKHLKGRDVLALYISDVEGDDLGTIGSGLLVPSKHPVSQADLLQKYPSGIQSILKDIDFPAPVSLDSGSSIEHQIVAHSQKACCTIEDKARDLMGESELYKNLPIVLHADFLHGMAADDAKRCVEIIKNSEPAMHIWGGETLVNLPENPGRGGRNQHFALATAIEVANDDKLYVLAAGTDGSDGPTHDAGGLVDGSTVERGLVESINAEDFMKKADAGSFLELTGDLIHTGSTGTNVMDVVIGLKLP